MPAQVLVLVLEAQVLVLVLVLGHQVLVLVLVLESQVLDNNTGKYRSVVCSGLASYSLGRTINK